MFPQQKYFYSIFRYRSLDKIMYKNYDIKIYYSESLIAKPGNYPAGYVDQIIFNDTVLGELIFFLL